MERGILTFPCLIWIQEIANWFGHFHFSHTSNHKCILSVYVDDNFGGHNNHEWYKTFEHAFNQRYVKTDLQPNYLLGIAIDVSGSGIGLSHARNITNLLAKYDMADCKPNNVPMDHKFEIKSDDIDDEEKEEMKN